MTGTATVHPQHWYATDIATLRTGWPHKLAAAVMVVIGGTFVSLTLLANLFHVGPAFDRMTDGFRPILTQQAIATDRADIAALASAGTEIRAKMLPILAQQLHMTPAQLTQLIAQQYPDVAAGLVALPTITPSFSGLITTLDQQRGLFQSADAIPTKNLPAATVPWSLLAVGIATMGLGVVVWFRPRAGAAIVTGVGVLLIAAPLALNLVHKASNADQLNANLKPVYNQQLVDQGNSSLHTLSAMGTQMQTQMLPALATQLHLTPAQLQALFQQNFPATTAALANLPTSLANFDKLMTTFNDNLKNYNTIKPVSFEPIVWTMIIGGGALTLLGVTGIAINRKRGAIT